MKPETGNWSMLTPSLHTGREPRHVVVGWQDDYFDRTTVSLMASACGAGR
jgi:hypothetical protein